LGKWNELKELLDQAMNIPGITKATIYNEYGIMYEQQGKLDQAIENFRNAGLNTLDQGTLDRAKASIARCKSKKELF